METTVQNLKVGTRPPWVGLGAAVWLQIASGNPYNFPLFSHSLKSVLGLNQRQLTILGVANDVGENVGIIPGIACNKLPPWIILLIGAFFCFFGYGVLWLAVTGTVASMPYWALWIALCVATNSSAWLGTAVLVTNMRNFPLSRGTVAGILKGYAGLSAAVYTEIFGILLRNSSPNLLLFLAIGVPILCLCLMYYVRPCTPASGEDPAEPAQFLFIQIASILLGLYLLTTTMADHFLPLSTSISYTLIVVMVLLLMAPLAIPVKMTFYPSSRSRPDQSDQPEQSDQPDQPDQSYQPYQPDQPDEPLIQEVQQPLLLPSRSPSPSTSTSSFHKTDSVYEIGTLLALGEGAVRKKRRPRRGEDFSFLEASVKADFWLLFLAYFAGVGSGVTVLNNLAQIGVAMGTHDTTVLLSLFSFCNFVGRLSGGAVSEHYVRKSSIPRTLWMCIAQLIMIMTYLLFASALEGTLYAATAILGVCYGVQFSTMVPTASELFGLKNFGVIFSFMSLGNPLGALFFSGILAGNVYDAEAMKQHSKTCLGPNCFRLTFYTLAVVCGVGSVLGMVLTRRLKPVYEVLYAGGSFRLPLNH